LRLIDFVWFRFILLASFSVIFVLFFSFQSRYQQRLPALSRFIAFARHQLLPVPSYAH
jgi:hypothetical protein